MGAINVIHYVLGSDYQDRDGKWVRHFSGTYDGVERRVTTRLGCLWNNVLQRTRRGSAFQLNKPTYGDVINCFESFSDFCDFCMSCPGFGRLDENGNPYALDKDIIGDGTSYSKDTCCFVPLSVNNLLLEKGGKKTSNLPVGITRRGSKYRVRDGSGNEQYVFNTIEEAITKKSLLKRERVAKAFEKVYYDERIVNALEKIYSEI